MVFEYYKALRIYISTISDIFKLGYNSIHHLGEIYDLTEEGVLRSMDFLINWKDKEYWGRMGYILGKNFQNILGEPENYYDYFGEAAKKAEEDKNYVPSSGD